jgi:hypothetical protein
MSIDTSCNGYPDEYLYSAKRLDIHGAVIASAVAMAQTSPKKADGASATTQYTKINVSKDPQAVPGVGLYKKVYPHHAPVVTSKLTTLRY